MFTKMIHAADGLLTTKNGEIILIKRKGETFHGFWALPGGTVEEDETVEETLIREMKEEVGVRVKPKEILGVFSDPQRDPRGRVISTVFICEFEGEPTAGSDAGAIKQCTLEDALDLNLAFDHKLVVTCYKRWIEKKGTFWSQKFLNH